MKKIYTGLLTLAICLMVACECYLTKQNPNTTYDFSYKDSSGNVVTGSVTTNEYGQAVVENVPDNVDCSSITFKEEEQKVSPEVPPES
jgi:hypothetical protein